MARGEARPAVPLVAAAFAFAVLLIACSRDGAETTTPSAATTATSAIPAEDLCSAAEELRQQRLLQEALDLYALTDEACRGASTAVRELGADLGTVERLIARAAADAGSDPEAARRSYLEALAIDRGSEEALAGLRSVTTEAASGDTTSASGFGPARQLLEAGYEDEAREETVEAMKEGARFDTLPESDQEDLDNDPGGAVRWERITSDVWDAIRFVLAAFVVVIFLVGMPVMWLAQRRVREGKWLARSPFVRKWLGTRLQFQAGAGTGVDAVGAQIRHVLRSASVGDEPRDIAIHTVQDADLDVPDLGTIDARLQPIVAATRLVVRPDIVRVTPTWASDEDTRLKRITVEMAVARRAGAPSSASYFAPVATTTAELAGRAAGWILYELRRIRPNSVPGLELRTGTHSAASYSAFLGGVQALAVGDPLNARNAFSEAVDADPGNVAAAQNLGAVEVNDPAAVVIAAGIVRLEGLM